jgi:hypothetical protein
MVVAQVGMKCPDCGTSKGMPLFQIRPERFLLAGITAIAAGLGASLVSAAGFFILLIATAYGYFAGAMILRASGMKRGVKLEILTGAGMVLGGIASRVVLGGSVYALLSIWFWAALGISTACAISKIRYL